MKTDNSILNMVIPTELLNKLKYIAKLNNISMAAQIRLILTQYCNNKK